MIVGEEKRNGGWRIYRKDYLPQEEEATTKEKSLWLDREINHEVGKEMLADILQDILLIILNRPILLSNVLILFVMGMPSSLTPSPVPAQRRKRYWN